MTAREALAGIVGALEAAADRGGLADWGYARGGTEVADWGYARGGTEVVVWRCHCCGTMYRRPDDTDRPDWERVLPADMVCDAPQCLSYLARSASSAWKQRGRLRDDEAVMRILRAVEADAIGFTDAADALETALFGGDPEEGEKQR